MNIPPVQPLQAPPALPAVEYEFTPAQNEVVAKLSSRMRIAGIVQVAFGALQLLGNCSILASGGSFKAQSTSSPVFIALMIAGGFLIASASAFQRIVTTEGSDIQHLMLA